LQSSGGNWRLLQPGSFIGAVIGAFVLLLIGQMMSKKR
jgi:uncharacterized membrane protein YeaQ/YmgE (transglycosylase-associated protein family)